MRLFGKKTPEVKTILILDVESGSVGGALSQWSVGDTRPKLFGEVRHAFRVAPRRDSLSLVAEIEEALRHTLEHLAVLAARLRNHTHTAPLGQVQHTAVFLSAPWGRPDLASGTPLFVESVQRSITHAIESTFGSLPSSFYTGAGAHFAGSRRVLSYEDSYLLVTINGEVSELILVAQGTVAGYATVPFGRHTVVRTLRTHGGLTDAEAHSILHGGDLRGFKEPLAAAQEQYAEGLAETVAELIKHAPIEKVYVVAHGKAGEWFARTLAESEALGSLFPKGGTIRSIGARHIIPHIAAHASEPDVRLGLQALFSSETF